MEKLESVAMLSYTGTKTVKACPMSRVQAEETIGRKMYKDSDDREDEPGYLIKYQDGYLSWSPLKVFHETYSLSETYLDRMKIELEEVKKRYLKGREFSMHPKSQAIMTKNEFEMLMTQLNAMERYIYILSQRIYIKEDVPCSPGRPEGLDRLQHMKCEGDAQGTQSIE